MPAIILALGLMYFSAHAFAILFQRTRIPDVLILMIIGLILGPIAGLVTPDHFGRVGDVLTTVALAVILFESGTSLSLKTLGAAAGPTLVLSLITFLATGGIIAALTTIVLGLPLELALLCGVILSGTSSAVVIPMVTALKPSEKAGTILVLESALTDVLCIIITFALLQAQLQGTLAAGPIASQIGISLGAATVLGAAGGIVWLQVWPMVRRFPSTTFTTIAAAFILYGIAEISGFSGAITTLVFGLTITNAGALSKRSSEASMTDFERNFYREVVFLLKTFFFVYLGLSFRFDNIPVFLLAAVAAAAIYFTRMWITRFALPRTASRRDAVLVSLLVPKGLAAAVLAGLPIQQGMEGGEIVRDFVFASVLISITTTAAMIYLSGRAPLESFYSAFFSRYQELPPVETKTSTGESQSISDAG